MGVEISLLRPVVLLRRFFGRNRRTSLRHRTENTHDADIKEDTADSVEENDEFVAVDSIEIKYKSSNKKLDLTSQHVINDDLFYKALSMHENPTILQEFTLKYKTKVLSIPVIIGQFDNLVILNLSNNGLADLPWSMLYLGKLEKLDLSRNFFEHIPRIIGYLRELRILDFRKNCLLTIPNDLLKLQKLHTLDLAENPKLRGITPEHIKKGVKEIFEIIRKRQGRSDLWANSTPWVGRADGVTSGNTAQTLHELAVMSILSHKVNFLFFDTVPPKLKTMLTERSEEYQNRIKVAKCSKCKYFYSSKEMFENHICQAG